jgi:hypothetical protein
MMALKMKHSFQKTKKNKLSSMKWIKRLGVVYKTKKTIPWIEESVRMWSNILVIVLAIILS